MQQPTIEGRQSIPTWQIANLQPGLVLLPKLCDKQGRCVWISDTWVVSKKLVKLTIRGTMEVSAITLRITVMLTGFGNRYIHGGH